MKQYRIFIQSFGIAAVLALVFVSSFNYQMDPHNRYQFKVSAQDFKSLAHSRDLVLITPGNFDDRTFLKNFIQATPAPSFAIIGGSRVMNFRPSASAMKQKRFLNAGVSAGSLKDYIALWQIMKQSEKIPPTLFLGLDPQSLNRAEQNNRWLAIAEHYQDFFKKGMSGRYYAAAWTAQLKELLSLQTTFASIRQIGKPHVRPRLVHRSDYDGKSSARFPDFSMIYPADYEKKSPDVVAALAQANGSGETNAFKKWNRKDPESFNQLRMLLTDMQQHHVKPFLILMPCHPLSLSAVKQDPLAAQSLDFFRQQLTDLSQALAIPYYDGFKETENGLVKNQDFSDGVHLKAAPIRTFFDRAARSFKIDSF